MENRALRLISCSTGAYHSELSNRGKKNCVWLPLDMRANPVDANKGAPSGCAVLKTYPTALLEAY